MKIGNLLPHALSFYHKVNAGGFFFWVGGYVSIVKDIHNPLNTS
jgi:hypothetical protein